MNYNDKKLIYARTIVYLVQLQIRSVFVIITLIFVVFRNSVLIMQIEYLLCFSGKIGLT